MRNIDNKFGKNVQLTYGDFVVIILDVINLILIIMYNGILSA